MNLDDDMNSLEDNNINDLLKSQLIVLNDLSDNTQVVGYCITVMALNDNEEMVYTHSFDGDNLFELSGAVSLAHKRILDKQEAIMHEQVEEVGVQLNTLLGVKNSSGNTLN